jgi:diphthamide biosynthesis enzyme Dph1/Dph2-like protein
VYMVWLGPPEGPALTHLQLSFAGRPWLLLDPAAANASQGLSTGLERLMKRRYYLVERARGASLVGLLVGTLGAAGYKAALQQLRRLAQQVRGRAPCAIGNCRAQVNGSLLAAGSHPNCIGRAPC